MARCSRASPSSMRGGALSSRGFATPMSTSRRPPPASWSSSTGMPRRVPHCGAPAPPQRRLGSCGIGSRATRLCHRLWSLRRVCTTCSSPVPTASGIPDFRIRQSICRAPMLHSEHVRRSAIVSFQCLSLYASRPSSRLLEHTTQTVLQSPPCVFLNKPAARALERVSALRPAPHTLSAGPCLANSRTVSLCGSRRQ